MVFVKHAGHFAEGEKGQLLAAILGGVVGGAVGGVAAIEIQKRILQDKTKSQIDSNEQKTNALAKVPISELLSMDKANFELSYSSITSLEIKKAGLAEKAGLTIPRSGKLKIETNSKKEDFDIPSAQDFEACFAILNEKFPGKLTRK